MTRYTNNPIFTAFENMEEVHKEVRKAAMRKFEAYVSDAVNYTPTLKYVGMKMIEFAMKEPKQFQLLYMREHDDSQTFEMLVDELGETVEVCIRIMEKGFAVVAEEIQKLSEQTRTAVESIGAIVHEVVLNTEKAVDAMEQNVLFTQSGIAAEL